MRSEIYLRQTRLSLFGAPTRKYINKIEMVQRRAIKWTLNTYSTYDSITQMQSTSKGNDQEPIHSNCTFFPRHHTSNNFLEFHYITTLALSQIHTTVNYYTYSFFPAAVVYWNRLPAPVATLLILDQFSVAVRSLNHHVLIQQNLF